MQMSYGNPPYSLFVSRLVEINLGGELFGYRVSTLLRARGLYWVYESAARQYWVTTAGTTRSPA